jgi:hypothetical protein
MADGVERYAHCQGEVNFRRRAPMQVAATLGFVLGRRNGQFLKGLRPKEMDAIREILVWGRQPLNNKILGFYGSVLEKFDGACRKLMSRIKSVLPHGCPRARIRATSREIRQPRDGELADTLGEEATGLVIVDPEGHPLKYNQMDVYQSILAKQSVRIDVDIPGHEGRGWKRSGSSFELDTQHDLDDKWKEDLSTGAKYMLQETWVRLNLNVVA